MKFPPGRAFQRKRYERLKAVARDLMADDLRRPLGTHRDRWNGWDRFSCSSPATTVARIRDCRSRCLPGSSSPMSWAG
jgi:hypothetical protein